MDLLLTDINFCKMKKYRIEKFQLALHLTNKQKTCILECSRLHFCPENFAKLKRSSTWNIFCVLMESMFQLWVISFHYPHLVSSITFFFFFSNDKRWIKGKKSSHNIFTVSDLTFRGSKLTENSSELRFKEMLILTSV